MALPNEDYDSSYHRWHRDEEELGIIDATRDECHRELELIGTMQYALPKDDPDDPDELPCRALVEIFDAGPGRVVTVTRCFVVESKHVVGPEVVRREAADSMIRRAAGKEK
jgi:hypothetical protein